MKTTIKPTKLILLLLTSTILIATSATADTGCFTYSDSGQYCQEITSTTAQEECSFFADCQLGLHYYVGELCTSLPICKKVFCKSSCDYEYFGKCSAGEVPEGEEAEWCSAGCCRFIYYNSFYCNYEENKWLCEIAAVNKDTDGFSFNLLDKNTCENFCFAEDGRKKFLAENQELEKPFAPQKNIPKSRPKQQEVLSNLGTLMGGGNQVVPTEKGGVTPWVLLGFILLVIGVYWFRKNVAVSKVFGQGLKLPETEEKEVKTKKTFLHELRFHPQVQERIKKLKKQHQEHVKEQKKKEFLTTFGGLPVEMSKVTKKEIHQLKELVREHKKKKFGAITKLKIKVPVKTRKERKNEAEQIQKKKEAEANISAVSKLKKIITKKK